MRLIKVRTGLRGLRDQPGASLESVSSRSSGTDGGGIAKSEPVFDAVWIRHVPNQAVHPAAAGATVCLIGCVGHEVAAVVVIVRAPH